MCVWVCVSILRWKCVSNPSSEVASDPESDSDHVRAGIGLTRVCGPGISAMRRVGVRVALRVRVMVTATGTVTVLLIYVRRLAGLYQGLKATGRG